MSTIAAARQTIVSFSDVRRSISLRSMILKPDRLEKRHELRLLLLHDSLWSGHFEKPGASVASRPTREHPRRRARQVDGGKANLTGLHGNDRRIECARLRGGQTDLLAPSIDIIRVGAAIAGKCDNGNVGLLAIFFRGEARIAHRRWRRRRPTGRNFPFYFWLVGT